MAVRTTKRRKETDDTIEPAHTAPSPVADLHSRITARAYEIFLARNGASGDELGDWLTAERELRGSLLTIVPPPDNVVPITTVAAKRKRTTTAKSSTSGSSTPKPVSATRARKQKPVSE